MSKKDDFIDWAELIKNISNSNNITLGMTDLVSATGVPASQLRYWIKQKYIIPISEETDRRKVFGYNTIFRVRAIKYFLDEGFKLNTAIEKVDYFRNLDLSLQSSLINHIESVKANSANDQIIVSLGSLSNTQDLQLIIDGDTSSFKLIPKK